MKKILIIAFMAAVASTMQARERSLAQKESAAARVLTVKTTRGGNTDLNILQQTPMFTIFGRTNGAFAIVANDDAFPELIGYSQDGLDNGNATLSWYLWAVGRSMESALATRGVRQDMVAPPAEFPSELQPLLTTVWDQGKPFNTYCPAEATGSTYPTGCVATAIAQIMNYHAYPVKGLGEHQYSFHPADGDNRVMYANFGETAYDWEHMLDEYKGGLYSDEEAGAVATLMLHCGVAVEMQYTADGSGAYSSEARKGLMNYFGYNQNLGLYNRNYYSLESWMNLIYTELNKNRPIYYTGVDAQRGGHAFVIDGYDSNGLVHVNWGWGSKGGNGYYDITLLNPSGYTFSLQQDMLLGIARPDEQVEYESHVVSTSGFSVTVVGTNMIVTPGSQIYNMSGDYWSGEIGLIIQGEGKTYEVQTRKVENITYYRTNITERMDTKLGGVVKLPEGIADGTYRVFIGARDEKDAGWRLVRRSEGLTNSYVLTIAGGSVTATADAEDMWPTTATTGIRSVTMPTAAGAVYDLQGRRHSLSPEQLGRGLYIIGGRKVVK